jgi:putative RecB family exonuclease
MVANPVSPPTLAELRKAPHVSYSQIKSYMMCPMKFYHSYQAKTEPSHRPLALVLGSAVHEALAAFYAHLQGTGMKIDEAELLAVFRDRVDREWDAPVPIKLDEGSDVGELLDQGIGLLRMFHEQTDCPTVLAVEQPFSASLYDPQTGEVFAAPLIGAMDLVVQGPQRPMVIEHKTAARKYTREQLAYETQPSVYAFAAEQIGLGKVDLLYQLLIKNKTPSLQHCRVTRTEAHIREMMETFASVVRAVDAGIFYRNRSWACADCTYAYRCNEGM